uniref:Uncharacterized protein n=1 Tax=Lepeophtheirus salmonis TaxID=72036 RepID=A0A0K2TU24_LEPSM
MQNANRIFSLLLRRQYIDGFKFMIMEILEGTMLEPMIGIPFQSHDFTFVKH